MNLIRTTSLSEMGKSLRRGLFFSLLLALTLPLVSCDSGGSNSSPDWVGNWEVTQNVNGTSPANPTFLDLDKDQYTTIVEGSSGCIIGNSNVLEVDGRTVTLDIGSGTERLSFDVSDGNLTVTVIESDNPNLSGGEDITAVSVDSDPREIAGCSS